MTPQKPTPKEESRDLFTKKPVMRLAKAKLTSSLEEKTANTARCDSSFDER